MQMRYRLKISTAIINRKYMFSTILNLFSCYFSIYFYSLSQHLRKNQTMIILSPLDSFIVLLGPFIKQNSRSFSLMNKLTDELKCVMKKFHLIRDTFFFGAQNF